MKTEEALNSVHNNKIYSHDEQLLAEYLKKKNLELTNKKWSIPVPRKSFYTEYGKRIADLLISVPAFIILLPIYAIISIGVLLDLGKPIIYKQTRVGKDGRRFDLYKFRSMNEKKNEKGELLPPKERVTRFGRIIRKLSLDELIGLWNIIKGDMSIIGPRPLPIFYVDRMSNRHKMRHCVRPGLECPRVIELDYPYTCKYQQTFENDIWYVENISFAQDIKMFLLLIKMVFSFKKRGAQAAVEGISYFLGYDKDGLAISMRTYKGTSKEKRGMKQVVLVTAIGTAASTTIVKELKKIGKYHVIGADMVERNQVATSLDVDDYYQFPSSTGEEYIPFALEFCKEHKINFYYAIIDDEVVNLTKNRESFSMIGTKLCLPDYEFTRKCHYKEIFLEWIENNIPEIVIKQYKNIEEIKKAEYPLFIKPHKGAASRGCKKVNSYEELVSTIDMSEIGKKILVQDYIDGKIITVDCIRNRKTGQSQLISRKEYLRNSDGCGIAVEIFHDDVLDNICHTIIDKLDLNGVVNIEFFDTDRGYRIVEINPRHSAGTVYSCMAGGDTVLNAIYVAEEKPCLFGDIEYGAHFTKRYEAYRMDK